jgi:predicted AlkP superfamily phosphohydrolase/phosphomutase/tetratricopeptide (TPR) repeat protein
MSHAKKVLLVGWDAADWKVIVPLMQAGAMPETKKLVENGVSGNIATLFPALSPMLWTSIATGKRPFKHGIYGFTEPTRDGRHVQPMTNVSRKCKAVWNILNQTDRKSIVVGWWPSHPAEPINGAMVSDSYHKVPRKPGDPWNLPETAIHPRRCYKELLELRVHPAEMTGEQIAPFIPHAAEIDQEADSRLSQCMRVLAECTSIHTAATHLLETEPWDFAAIYYDAIDHFSHGYMRFHPPRQEGISEEDFRIYQHVVTTGYIYHDMMLGRLIELAGDDTTVILMSDHGFHPDHLRPKTMPIEPAGPATEHRDFGIFVISGPGIRKGETVEGVSLLDVAPTILTAYGLEVGEDMDGRVLTSVFTSEPEVRTIPSWEDVPGESGQHPRNFQLDAEESKQALDQLVALGYIDAPSDDSDVAISQCTRELDYNLARSYMDAGMYGEAIPLLAALYRKHPLEFRFGIQLANCLQAMQYAHDLERVVENLNTQWRQAQQEARERLRGIASVLKARRKQWDEFKKIDDENKDTAPDTPRLARVGLNGRPVLFSDAEQHLVRKLRGISRGNPETLDYLAASAAMAKQDYEKALECLEKAEFTKSRSPVFQTQVGHVYLELRRLDDAERSFRQALEYDEYFPNALIGLCRVSLARGDAKQAVELGQRAIGLKRNFPPAHYFLALAQEETGDVDGAIESYRTAIELNPNFVEVHQRLSAIYDATEDTADLAAEHRKAARALQQEASVSFEIRDPIELPEISIEEIRAELPELPKEDPMTSETFLRCLALPPDSFERQAKEEQTETVTVVSGLPRSGTSMMMQMLAAAGIEPFSDGERVADENNPKGYYEAELVKQIAHKNDWVPQCAGHVVKVVAQLIPYLPQRLDYRVIFMDRPIEEVLVSQRKMIARLGTEGADLEEERLAETFARQVQYAMGLLKAHGVPVLVVPYRDAIEDPGSVAQRVAEFLGGDLDANVMAAAVDPSLYRERKP